MEIKHAMKTIQLACSHGSCAIAVFLLAACGTPVDVPTDIQQLKPTRSENPIELQPLPQSSGSLVQVLELTEEEAIAEVLPKNSRIPRHEDVELTRATLERLRGQYDQDLDLCMGMVTHNEAVPMPRVVQPPQMTYFRDPEFRSKTIRISNSDAGSVVKPMYSTVQAWNADETRLILYHSGTAGRGHHLYDGRTYEYIRKLAITPVDIEQVFWSHTEPNILYYVSRAFGREGSLYRLDIETRKRMRLAALGSLCSADSILTSGNDVQMPSWDDDLFGFRCTVKRSDNMYMHTYRVSTGEVRSRRIGQGTPWDNWLAPSIGASGKRLRVNDKVFNDSLNSIDTELDLASYTEHSSMGQTANGDDAYYAVAFAESPGGCNSSPDAGVAHLVEHNLKTGECRPLISESQGYRYPTSGTHISSLAHLRPQWIALSSIGQPQEFETRNDGDVLPPLTSEIYLVNTDPDNGKVCRVGHHRSHGKRATNPSYAPYFGEPHVSISPSGTRLLFGSDWHDSGAVDSYVIELPAYGSDLTNMLVSGQ